MKNLLTTTAMFLALASPALAWGSNDPAVSVAYADNLRGAALPTPWSGQAKFIGTPAKDGAYDAGAILITNTTKAIMYIDSVTVSIGPMHGINPWVAFQPFAIGPGKSMILTQTAFHGDLGANDFDTSDDLVLDCTHKNAFMPEVHISFASGEEVWSDATKVLTTGGWDRAVCEGRDESTPWAPIKRIK